METQELLLSNLRYLIGVPFLNGGRDPKIGLDCFGLFLCVMREFGVELEDQKVDCHDSARINAMFNILNQKWKKIDSPVAGCAVAMRLDPDDPNMVQHFGVYIGRRRFIHTLKTRNSSIGRIDDISFSNKIEGYYKWEMR